MELTATPRLSPGCRLHPSEPVLLIPEGALKLAGTARELLLLMDGNRTVADIVRILLEQYPDATPTEIDQDVLGVLDRLEQRGVIRT